MMTESDDHATEDAAGDEAGPAGAKTEAKEDPRNDAAGNEKEEAPAKPETEAESKDESAGDGKDEAPAKPETDDETAEEPAGEATPEERLEALGADIDQVRQQVRDPLNDGDEQFIRTGDADEDQPVDDTIAPPG